MRTEIVKSKHPLYYPWGVVGTLLRACIFFAGIGLLFAAFHCLVAVA